jgi:hypothetical protein
MHRYGIDGHVHKAKHMVSGVVLLSDLYVVMRLIHNYRKFKMVLCQAKPKSLLNIINSQILRTQMNSS